MFGGMSATTTEDKVIEGTYAEPTIPGAGPYINRPERNSWDQYRTMERPDGTRYRQTRQAHRWASEYAYGEWRTL